MLSILTTLVDGFPVVVPRFTTGTTGFLRLVTVETLLEKSIHFHMMRNIIVVTNIVLVVQGLRYSLPLRIGECHMLVPVLSLLIGFSWVVAMWPGFLGRTCGGGSARMRSDIRGRSRALGTVRDRLRVPGRVLVAGWCPCRHFVCSCIVALEGEFEGSGCALTVLADLHEQGSGVEFLVGVEEDDAIGVLLDRS